MKRLEFAPEAFHNNPILLFHYPAYPSLVIPNFYGAFPLVAVISGPIELATAPVLPFPVITIAIVAPFSSFTPDYSKTAVNITVYSLFSWLYSEVTKFLALSSQSSQYRVP